ncbi:MAG: KpsF/GutQ family sugar-phosphate isomerase [Alphaproteobacteria bacterium]|jgi:arabinose-5-phosphate isomerase|nr:KpsF/GutQ family sugar-phosphate isomerase [Alphaproteobacteria bacterium]
MTAIPDSNSTAGSDLEAARRVLAVEGDALGALARSLDQRFSRAVDLILHAEGRVIVSGMGKSGHIANKVAATLASTGTPAQFVHPGEASHGDLGFITRKDAALLISNSGKTSELTDIIEFTRRAGIPLIAITGGAESALAQHSDVALILPAAPEACPMGLAPTTSTTMQLALGDALAVAVMKRRGFTADDYRVLHPGGSLGRRLVRVADIMHTGTELPLVARDAVMSDVLLEMTSKRFGCVGVTNEAGGLLGVITDGDLRRHMQSDLLKRRAHEVMTGKPRLVRSGALGGEALRLMNQHAVPVTCLFVIEDDAVGAATPKPVGIVHVHDCLRAGVA